MAALLEILKDPATAAVVASLATMLISKWIGVTPPAPVPIPGPAPDPSPTPAPNTIQQLIRTVLLQVLQLFAGKLPPEVLHSLNGASAHDKCARQCCQVLELANAVDCEETAKLLREKVLPVVARSAH